MLPEVTGLNKEDLMFALYKAVLIYIMQTYLVSKQIFLII